jgi:hypothetical protein
VRWRREATEIGDDDALAARLAREGRLALEELVGGRDAT